jgi:hypothetical protein
VNSLEVVELDRAEYLERNRHLLDAEQKLELAELKLRARLLTPAPESEVAAAYLAAMKAKCAEEFGAWLENQALKYGKEIIPLLLQQLPALIAGHR